MSTTVAIHSFRGGTGKSNTTANLAALLALGGRRVGLPARAARRGWPWCWIYPSHRGTSGWRRSWTLSFLLLSGPASGPHAALHSFALNRRALHCTVRQSSLSLL